MIIRDWQCMIPHFKSVQKLEVCCFGDSAWGEKSWEKLFKNRELFVRLEFRKASLIGYCVIARVADEAELLRIAVKAECRRKGIGRRMLDHLFKEAASLGCRTIFLEVREDNNEAVRFYEKNSFQLVGRRERYYHNPVCRALLYSKPLKKS